MVAFYQALQQNPNKAEALRQAMLSTMQRFEDPRDWAAFVLLGDGF
jgi:CHAT domain-containing protein